MSHISPRLAAYLTSDSPLAYFITFRSYGTWLHGDDRGSVDRQHNTFGTSYLEPNIARARSEAQRLRSAPVALSREQRIRVDQAVRETCEHHGWKIHTLAVRTNHVHVVVTSDVPPERVMNGLKSWATRGLVGAGLVTAGTRVWARHGSTRYLWTQEQLDTACRYVTEGQDQPPGTDARC